MPFREPAAEAAKRKAAFVKTGGSQKRSSSTSSNKSNGGGTKICHFHTSKAGCRLGKECTYKHVDAATPAVKETTESGAISGPAMPAIEIVNDDDVVSAMPVCEGDDGTNNKTVSFGDGDTVSSQTIEIEIAKECTLNKMPGKIGHVNGYHHKQHMKSNADNNEEHGRLAQALAIKTMRDIGIDHTVHSLLIKGYQSRIPAMAAREVEKRIADSGASFHMTSKASMTEDEKLSTFKGPKVNLMTAKGPSSTETYVYQHLKELDTNICSLVLDESPSVVGLGKLLIDLKLDMLWRHGRAPILFDGPTVKHVMVTYAKAISSFCYL